MYYKLGINVGVTSTDAVLVTHENEIIANTKQSTTTNISNGIVNAITKVIDEANISKSDIKYAVLSTSKYINALTKRKELNKVGLIRLALPDVKSTPLQNYIPKNLREIIGDTVFEVDLEYELDGKLISLRKEKKIKKFLKENKGKIESLAITGIFSKILPKQERKILKWSRQILGDDVRICASHQIGGLGLLERENTTIVNAALQNLSNKIVSSFKTAIERLNLSSQLFISQNSGEPMPLNQVEDFPVLAISSSFANAVRATSDLSNSDKFMVIDIGSSTSCAMLVNAADEEILQPLDLRKLMMTFEMPNTLSVGIGGDTVVEFKDGECKLIKPSCISTSIRHRSLAQAGGTITISDFFLASGDIKIPGTLDIQSIRETIELLSKKKFSSAFAEVKKQIQLSFDDLVGKLKTDTKRISVVVSGGGAFLASSKIKGASRVVFLEHMEVARAYGACISKASSEEEAFANKSAKKAGSGASFFKNYVLNYIFKY